MQCRSRWNGCRSVKLSIFLLYYYHYHYHHHLSTPYCTLLYLPTLLEGVNKDGAEDADISYTHHHSSHSICPCICPYRSIERSPSISTVYSRGTCPLPLIRVSILNLGAAGCLSVCQRAQARLYLYIIICNRGAIEVQSW